MDQLPDLIRAFVEQHPVLAEHSPYLLVFGLLYLSGIGLPLPEEASLVLGGYLVYLNADIASAAETSLPSMSWPVARMIAAACVGILAGDLTVYWLGRRFGQELLGHRFARWILSKQNHDRIERFYDRWGHWAVFFSRFVAGIRIGSFFLAGATRVRLKTFLFMDGLGTLLSAPISVWLAYHFGQEIERALWWLATVFENLVYLVALVALGILWWQIRRSRKAAPPAL